MQRGRGLSFPEAQDSTPIAAVATIATVDVKTGRQNGSPTTCHSCYEPKASIATVVVMAVDDLFVLLCFSPACAATVSAVNLPQSAMTPGFSLQSAVPVLLFIGVHRIAGLRWAVIVATLWSVKLVVDRRRKGLPLGRFMPIVTAAVLIRGALGAITESESLYFGLGIATKYAVAVALAGSIIARRPLGALAAPYVMEVTEPVRQHRTFHTTMAIITAIAALYYCTSASLDVWLFRRSSVEGFVVLRFLANWPLSAAAIVAILLTAQSRLQTIPGVDSVSDLVERRMALHFPEGPTPSPPSPPPSPPSSPRAPRDS